MEIFRVRHSTPGEKRLLLVPMSFGVSSILLLHVLNEHLNSQKRRTGRTGYDLRVVHVNTSTVEHALDQMQRLADLKARYPSWQYSILDFRDVVHLPDLDGLIPKRPENDRPDTSDLEKLLISLPSATCRSDAISILRTRLLVNSAKLQGCECILWGDSTTRLAERTLAETAQGRGFSIPWQVSDGPTPFGVSFHFPMRDLLKKEISAFTEILEPPLTPLIERTKIEVIPTAKNTTIDQLMTQYFESVEENYPSIVANVVRTTSRLEAPTIQDGAYKCRFCQMPIDEESLSAKAWGGYQEQPLFLDSDKNAGRNDFCYGCSRTMPPQPPLST
ncbi:MAG: cytoplasmic tRNA 2-thiolation protein 2 [Bogoriella megaspora]|nr:MAG: cytoplasmic tRNA 2-thiolation protein 2 [Bogoriella megaspora]